MVVPERRRSLVAGRLLLALGLPLLIAACGSAGSRDADRKPLPPQTVASPRPEPPPPSEPPVATPSPPETVIVLDPGDEPADAPETLAEAARRERERRRNAPEPIAVINNKNLGDYAAGGSLTIAEPANQVEPEEAEALTADGHDEAWWRERGLEIRRQWRDSVDAVERLEGEAAELRRRFYATDDPYVRDAQVKPEWDRVLRELERARSDAEDGPRQVDQFLEEGRRAGALPGWLREGVELEPVPILPREDTAEPTEPVVVDPEPSTP